MYFKPAEGRSCHKKITYHLNQRLQIRLDDFRALHNERNKSVSNEEIAYETLRFYTYTTRVLLDDLSNIIRTSNGSKTWRNMVAYKNMLRGIERMGIEMSFGIIFIGNGKLSTLDFANFIENHKEN